MSRVILVKTNKGGVGKSWLTLQLAAYKAAKGNRVCILTSDSQNNILNFSGVNVYKENFNMENSYLENWLQKNNGEFIELRDNLSFIPLKNAYIKSAFKDKIKGFIDKLKKDFDFILIDSSPDMHLDNEFINVADDIVIPTFLDNVSTNSMTTLMKNVDLNKIRAIIPNRVGRTKLEKEYYNDLSKKLKNSSITLTFPIGQSSLIGKLVEKGKTIWELKTKRADFIKSIFIQVWDVIDDE